jgi:hypothetical protein
MAARGNKLSVEQVLERLFEVSDVSDDNDSDILDDDNYMEQIIGNAAIVNDVPMVQSDRDVIVPCDRESGWDTVDNDIFTMPFIAEHGLNCDLPNNPTAMDFFHILFDAEMWGFMCEQTNLYADFVIANSELRPHSRIRNWTPVTVDEMKVFFGLVIAMGLVKKIDVQSYWSKTESVATPFFGSRMSKDRFLLILSNLHLNDNTAAIPRGEPGHDALYKLRPFISMTQKNFGKYTPEQDLSLDEGLCPFKGRVHFKVYNPMKPNKFGVKLYQVCEASSGYCVGYDIYHGATDCVELVDTLDETGEHYNNYTVTSKVVLGLLTSCGLLSKGYHVYMDNYYTSPELFDELVLYDTYACGTLRINRKNVPKAFGRVKKMKPGDVIYRRNENLLAIKFHDKRDVHMLTTIHQATMSVTNKIDRASGAPIIKPTAVVDYIKKMGGVDLSDQIIQYYDILRKSVKWWKKVFFHLFNLLVVNSYILMKKYGQHLRIPSHQQFRIDLIQALIESAPDAPRPKTPGRKSMDNLDRLTGRHFIQHIKPKEGAKKQKPMRDCVVCNVSKNERDGYKRKQTAFECKQCAKPMCMPVCFERYHTVKDFKQIPGTSDN